MPESSDMRCTSPARPGASTPEARSAGPIVGGGSRRERRNHAAATDRALHGLPAQAAVTAAEERQGFGSPRRITPYDQPDRVHVCNRHRADGR